MAEISNLIQTLKKFLLKINVLLIKVIDLKFFNNDLIMRLISLKKQNSLCNNAVT